MIACVFQPLSASVDFTQSRVSITFSNASRRMCTEVPTLHDFIVEAVEMFTVIIETADHSVVMGLSNSTGVIYDDDCKYTPISYLTHNQSG